MKKIILPLLILAFPFMGLSAQMYFNSDGLNFRLVKDTVNGNNDLSAMVITIGEDNYKGDITIPSSVMHNGVGYPVTAIDNMAFRCCKQLTSINIPASVVNIPAAAFYGSYNLRSIVVSEDNMKYDSRENCNAVIESQTGTLIASCENTVVPEDIIALGDCAFFGNHSITSFTIDGRYYKMGRWVFLDCDYIETLNWDSHLPLTPVTKLLKSSLKNVVLGDCVSSISDYAFADCKNLESINIPSSVKVIGTDAFKGCSSLKSITIPYGVEEIGFNAFDFCDNVETLYWNSNGNLHNVLQPLKSTLKTIVIGDSVKSLDASAFQGCKNVVSVTVSPGNPVYDSRNNCNMIIESASNKVILGCKTSTIPGDVTAIDEGAFSYCGSPKTVSLPSTLLSIADYAFRDCDSLTALVIPANVNKIGSMIVYGCTSLTSLSVDPANTFYDSRDNCNSIIEKRTGRLIAACSTSTIPSGVTAIAANSFRNFTNLKSLNFPSSLRVIGDYAFCNCINLESVSFPSSMDSIGEYAFSDCKSLSSISIPSGIRIIETGAFQMCDTLTSVDIQPGVEKIKDMAFYGCSSIKSLSIPPTVKEIGWDAFNGCFGIRTAGPKGGGYDYEFSWDTIPENAFLKLYNLESVYIPKTVKAIYECSSDYITDAPDDLTGAVFEGCSNLKTIAISFKDTKLYRCSRFPGMHFEYDMDYNLYRSNPVSELKILDDTIVSFSAILTDAIKELVISKDVKVINPDAFAYSPLTTYFYCQKQLYDDWNNSYYYSYVRETVLVGPNLENISVEAGNSKYTSYDGVLYNSDQDELLAYPIGRKGDYKIPSTVKVIQDQAFYNSKISSVVIPKSVQRIGNSAFEHCDSLKEVTIEGQSEIGLNAFHNCKNIQGVWTRSATPGLMNIFDEPQTVITSDFSSAQDYGNTLKYLYDSELGRSVTEISYSGRDDWECYIDILDLPEGNYKLSMGVLPSIDEKPVYIHPSVYGYTTDNRSVRLLDSIKIEFFEIDGMVFETDEPYYLTNDVSGYDTLTIGNIEIPEGYSRVRLYIRSGVYYDNSHLYSSRLLLDRIYIEPLDKDAPIETYAGTFTANVFNNATLYVPDGAIDAYKAADGWKLFKNIAVNDRSYPADEVEVSISDAGYATFYYSDGDYVLPEGLSAMIVSGMSDDRLEYTTIASGSDQGVIPAGVPVILVSDSKNAGVYKLTLTDHRYEYKGTNLLIGSDVATQTYAENSSRFYKLAYGPTGTDLKDVLGWYWGAADGGAFNIEAHKAWLALPKTTTKGMAGFTMSGETTFVIDIEAGNYDGTTIYDIFGRRISAPTGSGLYIINGKKIIVTE